MTFDTIYQTIDQTLHELIEFLYFQYADGSGALETQVKSYHDERGHRLKIVRPGVLDVTYGLKVLPSVEGRYFIEASVNNKVAEFNIHDFVRRLAAFYYTESLQKPWTRRPFADKAYEDFLNIEPQWGTTVSRETREGRADVIRVLFTVRAKYFSLLQTNPVMFRQLVYDFCFAPLRRVYGEIYQPGGGGKG
ncbi:MAG TPA: hypothetical protein VGK99_18160 [Acidobacteriota bacterium]